MDHSKLSYHRGTKFRLLQNRNKTYYRTISDPRRYLANHNSLAELHDLPFRQHETHRRPDRSTKRDRRGDISDYESLGDQCISHVLGGLVDPIQHFNFLQRKPGDEHIEKMLCLSLPLQGHGSGPALYPLSGQ